MVRRAVLGAREELLGAPEALLGLGKALLMAREVLLRARKVQLAVPEAPLRCGEVLFLAAPGIVRPGRRASGLEVEPADGAVAASSLGTEVVPGAVLSW